MLWAALPLFSVPWSSVSTNHSLLWSLISHPNSMGLLRTQFRSDSPLSGFTVNICPDFTFLCLAASVAAESWPVACLSWSLLL